MSTRRATALYADVPMVSENGSALTTVMRQGQCEDFSVRSVIGMCSDTYGIPQRQWSELPPTSGNPLLYRC